MRNAWPGVPAVLLGAFMATVALAGPPEPERGDTPPPGSMADDYWGANEMARARQMLREETSGQRHLLLLADRLERQSGDGGALTWDVQGWYGGDLGKLWIKTEGDYSLDDDGVEDAEIQLLWSRPVSAFFDVQAGVRHDAEPDSVTHAVVGVQGLAPYWFEIDAAVSVSETGDVAVQFEAEYELRLTQRLVLQPRAELAFAAQGVPERELESGLTGIDLGVRLRYEIRREVAPYVGVERQSVFGKTADIAGASDADRHRTAFVAGLRVWF